MIDEKILVERLEETRWTTIFDTSCIFENDKLDKCIKIVNQLAEESNNGWIPCSERLPEFRQFVLATVNVNYATHEVVISRYGKEEYWFNGIILAWQPLPAPYQPKE